MTDTSHDITAQPIGMSPTWWFDGAACKDTFDPRFFGSVPDQREAVAEYCDRCPVIDDCVLLAEMRDEQVGLWGGRPSATKYGYKSSNAPISGSGTDRVSRQGRP